VDVTVTLTSQIVIVTLIFTQLHVSQISPMITASFYLNALQKFNFAIHTQK